MIRVTASLRASNEDVDSEALVAFSSPEFKLDEEQVEREVYQVINDGKISIYTDVVGLIELRIIADFDKGRTQ